MRTLLAGFFPVTSATPGLAASTHSVQVAASLPPRAAISASHLTAAPEETIYFSPLAVMQPVTTALVSP